MKGFTCLYFNTITQTRTCGVESSRIIISGFSMPDIVQINQNVSLHLGSATKFGSNMEVKESRN